MKLSNHFNLEEFEHSHTAIVNHIENRASDEVVKNIKQLVDVILEPARSKLDWPIIISSGYRCEEVNRMVGGSPTSYHRFGKAADIKVIEKAEELVGILKKLPCTELIVYRSKKDNGIRWIHVAYDKEAKIKPAYSVYR